MRCTKWFTGLVTAPKFQAIKIILNLRFLLKQYDNIHMYYYTGHISCLLGVILSSSPNICNPSVHHYFHLFIVIRRDATTLHLNVIMTATAQIVRTRRIVRVPLPVNGSVRVGSFAAVIRACAFQVTGSATGSRTVPIFRMNMQTAPKVSVSCMKMNVKHRKFETKSSQLHVCDWAGFVFSVLRSLL